MISIKKISEIIDNTKLFRDLLYQALVKDQERIYGHVEYTSEDRIVTIKFDGRGEQDFPSQKLDWVFIKNNMLIRYLFENL